MSREFKIYKYDVKLWWILIAGGMLVILGFFLWFFGPARLWKTEAQYYTVAEGSTVDVVASDLDDAGIIKNELSFKVTFKLMNGELYAETYELSGNMWTSEIVSILSNPTSNLPAGDRIIISEGVRLPEVAVELEVATGIAASEFMALWNDPVFLQEVIDEYEFITDEILNPEIKDPLEGYLYPATYYFTEIDTAESITKEMLDQMELNVMKYSDVIEASDFSYHEILTLASIVQMEASNFEDMKKVSSVFYNRLKEGMPLQSCATVNYALGKSDFHLTEEQTKVDDPYNTYNESSLPPGPISNVSAIALEAAVLPDTTNYYYFLADQEGNTYFASTYEEHLVNKDTYVDPFD